MPHLIEDKLVIAVASSALFDLKESDNIYVKKGLDEYRKYQSDNIKNTLKKGVAFPFIKRFLSINNSFPTEKPVEVVLLSRNDPDTGQRVFNSVHEYGLDISRAGFLCGKSPYKYIPAFNVSLFLSANKEDVYDAIEWGHPAGRVINSDVTDIEDDYELRVAFDFDGVIVDDEAEVVYAKQDLEEFQKHEQTKVDIPHNPGPLCDLFKKLSMLRALEFDRKNEEKDYRRILRTAIVTARNAPAHERVVTTLNNWGVIPDEAFFLGGIDKRRILEIMKPHIFFDDQMTHIDSSVVGNIPSVHVPFGIRNVVKAIEK